MKTVKMLPHLWLSVSSEKWKAFPMICAVLSFGCCFLAGFGYLSIDLFNFTFTFTNRDPNAGQDFKLITEKPTLSPQELLKVIHTSYNAAEVMDAAEELAKTHTVDEKGNLVPLP